jgi:hypothetical protein
MQGAFIDIIMLHKLVNNPPCPARRGEHVPNFKGDVIELEITPGAHAEEYQTAVDFCRRQVRAPYQHGIHA